MLLSMIALLTCRGSELYMSPEMASATMRAITDRADVYSLGVVLLEMFTLKSKWCPGRIALTGVSLTRTLPVSLGVMLVSYMITCLNLVHVCDHA